MLFSDLEMEKLLCGTLRFASSKMLSIITILGNKFKFLLHSSSTKNVFFYPAAGGETVIKKKTEVREITVSRQHKKPSCAISRAE